MLFLCHCGISPGSHVCGSVAGSLLTGATVSASTPDLAQFQGQAPGARLAFFDAGDPLEALLIPVDIGPGMFAFAYAVCCRYCTV